MRASTTMDHRIQGMMIITTFNSQQDNRNKQEEIFQTPVAGVSPFLIRQLQSNNPTNPFTINQTQQIQQSGSNFAAQEPQNNYRINSTGMAQTFSSPGLSNISLNLQSPGVNSSNGNSQSTFTNSSTLNPNATPFIPKDHNQVNIPPFSQISSPSVSQQNPFLNNTSTTGGLMNGNSAQGTQSYPLHPTNFLSLQLTKLTKSKYSNFQLPELSNECIGIFRYPKT